MPQSLPPEETDFVANPAALPLGLSCVRPYMGRMHERQ